jgi:plastocyanin
MFSIIFTKEKSMKNLIIYFLAGAAILIGVVQNVSAEEPETHEITIRNFNFYPPDPLINVGDTVVWKNTMNYGHWVISGVDMRHDNKFFSYMLLNGHKFSFTFRTPGDFPYYCPIHSMQATISVVAPEGTEVQEEVKKEEEKTDGSRRRRRR